MDVQEQRRLLELAARAAGCDVVWNERWQCFQYRSPRPDQFGRVRHMWVPNEDDGDALRLAIDLELDVSLGKSGAVVEFGQLQIEELDASDPYAAVRLAIVRAAAAIGEKMEAKP